MKDALPEIGNKVVLVRDQCQTAAKNNIPIGSIGTFVRTGKTDAGIWSSTVPVVQFGAIEIQVYWSDIRRATKNDF